MDIRSTPWSRADTLRILLLAGLTVALLAPYLFTSPPPLIMANSDLGTDLPREVYPLVKYVADTWRTTGIIPTWRTYTMSGYPLAGHPVVPMFYPPNWTAPLLPLTLWLNLHTTAHLLWAGIGMYLCLRWLNGVQPDAAFVGALIFGHAPRFFAHISGGHVMMLASITWLPWTWLMFHLFYRTSRAHWAALLGVTLAAYAVTNGFYLAAFGMMLALCAPFYGRGRWAAWLRQSLWGGGLALLVMLGLAAVQLLPMIDVIQESHRSALTLADAMSLEPALLLGMFFPFKLPIAEWYLYLGVGAVLLSSYAVTRDGRRTRGWLLGIALVLVLCVGSYTPVYTLLYQYVPGFTLFRVPQRFYPIAMFAVAALAGIGVSYWLRDGQITRRFRLLALGVGAFYLGSIVVNAALGGQLPFYVLPYALAAPLLVGILLFGRGRWRYPALLLVLLADLWAADHSLIRPSPESVELRGDPLVTALAERIRPGERAFAPYAGVSLIALLDAGIPAADGSEPIQIKRYAEFLARASGCDFAGYSVGAPPTRASAEAVKACPTLKPNIEMLHMLNVRFVILPAATLSPDYPIVYQDTERIAYDIGAGRGRAWLSGDTQVTDPPICLDTLTGVESTAVTVLESPPPDDESLTAAGSVSLDARSVPNGEAFIVETEGEALLVRSEAYANGWTATLNGEPADVIPANCALQGVWLPGAGRYQVVFTYAPARFVIGAAISVGTLLALLAAGTWMTLSRLRTRQR
ncbi:MAG: hypothetical protein JNJ61_21430 [Anaerolineae bacterium]|nr:hypothetical protein [Anaerolineae bacterium]